MDTTAPTGESKPADAAADLLTRSLNDPALASERAQTFSRWHPVDSERRRFWRSVASILQPAQGV